jgi:hypothetical protein
MRQRCYNPKDEHYKWYGARGITVCPEWESFQQFLSDMGPRPEGTTLDRKEQNGNYEPDNCRWATSNVQNNNRRDNKLYEFEGKSLTLAQWSEICGFAYSLLYDRINYLGWSVERTLTTNP